MLYLPMETTNTRQQVLDLIGTVAAEELKSHVLALDSHYTPELAEQFLNELRDKNEGKDYNAFVCIYFSGLVWDYKRSRWNENQKEVERWKSSRIYDQGKKADDRARNYKTQLFREVLLNYYHGTATKADLLARLHISDYCDNLGLRTAQKLERLKTTQHPTDEKALKIINDDIERGYDGDVKLTESEYKEWRQKAHEHGFINTY